VEITRHGDEEEDAIRRRLGSCRNEVEVEV